MSRKILKILISVLFLAVAALVAVAFAIKTFMPDLFETPKYGVGPVKWDFEVEEPAGKPVYEENLRDDSSWEEMKRLQEEEIQRRLASEDKYGVAPIRRHVLEPSKYGPGHIRDSKYGVAPIRHNTQTKN